MTTPDDPTRSDSSDLPEPIVERGRGISLVWVIPVVAILVGAGIGIDAIRNRGIEVVITLPNAEWVEAGKTKIRYLDIDIGTVDEVRMNADADGVEVHCTLDKETEKYLTDGAAFWLVYPRVGAGGISGLGTLVSGAYFAMELGPVDGKKARQFAALVDPPLGDGKTKGLKIQVHAETLSSLQVGSPVYFREIQVGKVVGHEFADGGTGVVVRLYIEPDSVHLVRADSRFWSAGGIQVSGSLTDFEVDTESLRSIVAGGIAFDSPSGEKASPAAEDAVFWLHPTKSDVESYPLRYGGLRIYVEGPSLGSVALHDLVSYRNLPVGAVVSRELLNDSKHVRIGLNIQPRYAPLVRNDSVFWDSSGITASLGLKGLEIHTGSFASILAGGIAFATPNSPGHRVKAGSVFELRAEVEDEWLGWSPMIWRGPPGEAPPEAAQKKESGVESKIAHFFHHENKDEEQAKQDSEAKKDPSQEGAREQKRHGFFHRLFH